jgi:hypothetical protein
VAALFAPRAPTRGAPANRTLNQQSTLSFVLQRGRSCKLPLPIFLA